jgi:CheY-like chemotaxis protein
MPWTRRHVQLHEDPNLEEGIEVSSWGGGGWGGGGGGGGEDAHAAATLGGEGDGCAPDEGFELALVDVNLPDSAGTDMLPALRDACPNAEIVVITGHATLDAAVEAAAARARAEALAGGVAAPKGTAVLPQSQLPGAPVSSPGAFVAPVSSPGAFVAPVASPTPPASSSSLVWMVAAFAGLFLFLTLCLVSCILFGYLYQHR